MNAPRLFMIGGSLLLLNAAAVLTTGLWRHVLADEPQAAAQSATDAAESTDLQNPASEPASGPPRGTLRKPIGEPVDAANQAPVGDHPLDHIPVPDSLPTIPSLADPDSLKDDPGFQEFSRLFSKVEESWEIDYPASVKPRTEVQSAAYFESLDKRLQSAEQLCVVARSIAAEAAEQALSGHTKQSEELLQMATQLRDMAAKLLVAEL